MGKNGGKGKSKGQEAPRPLKASSSGNGPAIDLDTVRELARIAGEFNLSEVEADPAGHIRLRRESAGAVEERIAPRSQPSIGLAPPLSEAASGTFINSPFVGTFYRSPSPDDPVFVEVGQTVRKGQVVCIVEAMKLMNEIEAETDGKIAEVLVGNGEHVEYGQQLFRLA